MAMEPGYKNNHSSKTMHASAPKLTSMKANEPGFLVELLTLSYTMSVTMLLGWGVCSYWINSGFNLWLSLFTWHNLR